jgi:DNA-directed RNA polymerase subunit RPC12/RpoP
MNRHLTTRDPIKCPRCGSAAAVRLAEWSGEPTHVCGDCSRAGHSAEAYFTPACAECNGTGITALGYVADDGETYMVCERCR